jgi:hypothetical protein
VNTSAEMIQSTYANVQQLPEKNCVSVKKKQDVEKLLKFVTLSDSAQNFYTKALSNNTEVDIDNNVRVYDEEEPFL